MKKNDQLDRLEREFARLKSTLLSLGPVLQGSILSRTIRRDDPQKPGHMKDYGPYYQWTRKREGRTVIQNLGAAQKGRKPGVVLLDKPIKVGEELVPMCGGDARTVLDGVHHSAHQVGHANSAPKVAGQKLDGQGKGARDLRQNGQAELRVISRPLAVPIWIRARKRWPHISAQR